MFIVEKELKAGDFLEKKTATIDDSGDDIKIEYLYYLVLVVIVEFNERQHIIKWFMIII